MVTFSQIATSELFYTIPLILFFWAPHTTMDTIFDELYARYDRDDVDALKTMSEAHQRLMKEHLSIDVPVSAKITWYGDLLGFAIIPRFVIFVGGSGPTKDELISFECIQPMQLTGAEIVFYGICDEYTRAGADNNDTDEPVYTCTDHMLDLIRTNIFITLLKTTVEPKIGIVNGSANLGIVHMPFMILRAGESTTMRYFDLDAKKYRVIGIEGRIRIVTDIDHILLFDPILLMSTWIYRMHLTDDYKYGFNAAAIQKPCLCCAIRHKLAIRDDVIIAISLECFIVAIGAETNYMLLKYYPDNTVFIPHGMMYTTMVRDTHRFPRAAALIDTLLPPTDEIMARKQEWIPRLFGILM